MTEANPQQTSVKMRIIRSSAMPIIYVEGVTQMVVSFPNSRLRLSGLVERTDNGDGEEHMLACELIMPTSSMLEIAQYILQNMAQNKAALQQGGAEWMAKVQEVFETLRPPEKLKQE